jgi:thioredoxin 1
MLYPILLVIIIFSGLFLVWLKRSRILNTTALTVVVGAWAIAAIFIGYRFVKRTPAIVTPPAMTEQNGEEAINVPAAPVQTAASIVHITSKEALDLFVKEHPVAVIKFGAQWCPPCQRLQPVLENLAARLTGKIWFAHVDVDESNALAGEFGITGMPTLFIFRNGTQVSKHIGGIEEQPLYDLLMRSY